MGGKGKERTGRERDRKERGGNPYTEKSYPRK